MSANPGVRYFFNQLVWLTRLGIYQWMAGRAMDQRGFRGAVNLRLGEDNAATWHCILGDQSTHFYKGPHPQPLGTVTLSEDLFLRMMAGHTSYYTAEMTGKVRVEGDGHSAWIVSSIITQAHAQARKKGLLGWMGRHVLKVMLKKSGTGYDLRL